MQHSQNARLQLTSSDSTGRLCQFKFHFALPCLLIPPSTYRAACNAPIIYQRHSWFAALYRWLLRRMPLRGLCALTVEHARGLTQYLGTYPTLPARTLPPRTVLPR